MGGPCTIPPPPGAAGATALKRSAPPCTDNFHVALIEYEGSSFHSAEHAYQACKFLPGSSARAHLVGLAPRNGEPDRAFGVRVWKQGQAFNDDVRPDWGSAKVRVMYEINLIKYKTHPDLQEDLVSTSGTRLHGPQSTKWTYHGSRHTWKKWNGWIQMRIREELLDEDSRNAELLAEMIAHFDAYDAVSGIDAADADKAKQNDELDE